MMKATTIELTITLATLCAVAPTQLVAQSITDEVRARVETARAAAGDEHAYYFNAVCTVPIEAVGAEPVDLEGFPTALPSTDPDRDWYAEPVRVFDDLFFLGQTAYSVWGLRTSAGVILVDAIFDYSVEAEVIDGLRELGIDPNEIRYVIVSHAHRDHSGGAGILQQRYGAQVVMSEADWDLYEATSRDEVKATRDVVATDGMELTLGDHVVRTYLTPGHTLGTIATVMTVHDGDEEHLAMVHGGTTFNFRDAPGDPRDARLGMYAESASRMRELAQDEGIDVLLSNHTAFDSSPLKMPELEERREGDPHPYVIGTESVTRFLTVAEECAVATRLTERPRV
ncbi:MAG: MBL fold metallo-hydrolase [Gemmatimonadota bacterium]|jgi:metallo-beta-lactamase class B